MASPQTAHGYTKVANAIMRALYRFPFSGQEMRLLLWVLRDSYGWREKQTHSAPLSRICDETGIPRATASWVVRKLVKGGVLVQVRGRSLRFNKDYDEWLGTAPDMLPLLAAAKAEAEPEESRRGSALKPPTAADVRAYCLSRNSPVDADKFWHHYEATNWMSGRSRVTNWKSMVCFFRKGRNPPRHGVHTASKLTAENVREIRAAIPFKRGDVARMSRDFSVSRNHIYNIALNRKWANMGS